ncbi:MAG: hypothetical protein OXN16_07190 [Gammaproteobacteria bacterium]|nr:hypothetical protein [Gammaproteobacteria bacterium]
MTKTPNISRLNPMRPDNVQAEDWMKTIRQEEAKALSELHQFMIERIKRRWL